MAALRNFWKLSLDDLIAVALTDCCTTFAQDSAFFRKMSYTRQITVMFIRPFLNQVIKIWIRIKNTFNRLLKKTQISKCFKTRFHLQLDADRQKMHPPPPPPLCILVCKTSSGLTHGVLECSGKNSFPD